MSERRSLVEGLKPATPEQHKAEEEFTASAAATARARHRSAKQTANQPLTRQSTSLPASCRSFPTACRLPRAPDRKWLPP
jgi:hypothetical protein